MLPTTFYVSRVLHVPPLVACAAYDDLADESPVWHIRTGQSLLVITGQARSERSARAIPVRLRSAGGRMTGALEIEPWSSRRTHIGIRPERWGLRTWPTAEQINGAHDALHRLAEVLHAWAEEPLREVAATWHDGRVINVTDRWRWLTR